MWNEFWNGWKYYRVDYQPWSQGWRIWFYVVQYDGWHYALHLGPIVVSHGDGIPPKVKKLKENKNESNSD
jgi:hypothetical protein